MDVLEIREFRFLETDFLPLYAGEWFVREVQMYKEYKDSRIIIISATSTIKRIADKYNVECIPKYMCKTLDAYNILKEKPQNN